MSDLNTTARITLQANGKEVEDTLKQLKQRAFDLENAIAKAAAAGNKADLKKLQTQLRSTRREIKNMTSSAEETERVLKRMDKASPKELKEALRQLNKQLENMERGSEAWEKQTSKIRALRSELNKINGEMREGESGFQRFNRRLNDMQTSLVAGAAALTGLVQAGRTAVNAYAEMDSEMANVRKFTGMTQEEVGSLNEEFKKMDTRTSREQLNQLAQEAGRLGKTSQEDVLGFVKAADQINVALDDLGEGATLTLSKLANIFGDEKRLGTEKSLLSIGSVINELSQNCTASAPYLADFAKRMAGVGAQAQMTIPQIMGFAAVLDSQGQAVEMSATALSKLIMDMFKEQDKIIKATGVNAEKFKETLKKSTNEGLIMLIERLKELGNIDVLAPVFKEMGENGARASQVISALAANIDMVKWEQDEANKAFQEATSVTNEFNVQNTTVQAGLDKAKKRVREIAVELGEKLAPVMKHVISSTSLILKAMSTTISFVSNNIGTIATLTAMIVAYTVAVNAAAIKTKLHAAYIATTTVVMKAYQAVVKTLHAAHLLLQLGLAKLEGNWPRQSWLMLDLKKASASLAQAWGVLIAAGIALAAAIYAAYKKVNEAKEGEKALLEVRKKGAEAIADEKFKIEQLIAAAKDEKLSLDERQKAIAALNQIIPNYNAKLDETTGKYTENKKALDAYLSSLQRKYEIEGAKEMLKKIGKDKAEKNIELNSLNTQISENEQREREINRSSTSTQAYGAAGVTMGQAASMTASSQNARLKYKKNKAEREIQSLDAQAKAITGVYGSDISKSEVASTAASSTNSVAASGGAAVTSAGGKSGGGKSTSVSNKLQEWKEREEAINRIAYAKGEKDYEAYTSRMQEIAVEYAKKQMERSDLTNTEKAKAEANYYEAIKKQHEEAGKMTLEEENNSYAEQLAALQQRYINGESDQKQYENATELLELQHLKRMVELTQEGTKERENAEKAYRDRQLADVQKKQKEAEAAQAKMAKLKEQYFGMNSGERNAMYSSSMSALEQVYAAELNAAGDNAKEKLRIEEAFQKAKLALQKQYNQEGAEDGQNKLEAANGKMAEWLESDGGKAVTESFNTITSGMSSIFSGMSSLVQAELDIQTAAIEKRYEKEIEAAQGNTYKTKKLEEKKEKEIAEAKNKANKKMFAMQVIQAVAQTAQNALSAYGSAAAIPVVGYIMAPIAAAMATAAGLMQVAAIKKQQQASEAQGYAEGGFTPQGDRLKPVGVVHAGEWVAPQRLVNSPKTRPMIEALEAARRSNTIGMLPQTNTESIAQENTAAVQQSLEINACSIAAMNKSIEKLNERLKEPFVTVNTVEGDSGIKKAQSDYERLMKNKAPKRISHAN